MTEAQTITMEERLAELRNTYASQLEGRIGEIKAVLDAANSTAGEPMNAAAIKQVRDLCHKMAGSGATFGFAEVSEIARDMERLCNAVIDVPSSQPESLSADLFSHCQRLLDAANVKVVAESAPLDPATPAATEPTPNTGNDEQDEDERRNVLMLDGDEAEYERLSDELGHFGFDVKAISDPGELEAALAKGNFSALIADIAFNDDGKAGLDLLNRLRGDDKLNLPVIVNTEIDDINHRLGAVRAGAYHYMIKPVEASDIVDTLDKACDEWKQDPFRILIVDDDESVLRHTELVLQGAGMTTRAINDPMTVMDVLEDFVPELVLLDLYMPDCNGQEIAAVIRQHKSFDAMPIVFLSGESDKKKQLSAMELGGDDFLTKPIQAQHLISAVTIRAGRFRELRSMMVRDSMTGLFNHTTTKQLLDNELSRAERTKIPLSMAALDIDHFKKVNDTYGHAIGDTVIKSLARLLKQRLRGADIVGRMGGEEFAAVLPGASIVEARVIFEQIRMAFSEMVFRDGETQFSVTISCGISEYPVFGNASELSDAADKALYAAKHGGRNKVVCDEEGA